MADGAGDHWVTFASGLGALATAVAAWIWGQVRGRRQGARMQPPAPIEQTQLFFDGPLEEALKGLKSCERSLSSIEHGLADLVREQRSQNDRIDDQARDFSRVVNQLRESVDDQAEKLKKISETLDRWPKNNPSHQPQRRR